MNHMNRLALIAAAVVLMGAGCISMPPSSSEVDSITDFDSCAAAGNPIMESYPRQCAAGGKTYVEQL
jgi:hypothetical protein